MLLRRSAREISAAVDMWAAGCVIVEMVSKTPLFKVFSEKEHVERLRFLLGPASNINWPDRESLDGYADWKHVFERS